MGLDVGPAARPCASRHRVWCCVAIVAVVLGAQTLPAAGQGIALRGVGPINESMGGVAVGCPIDASGAIHWNPASISGLPCSEMAFGIGLLLPTTELSSRIASPIALSGSDDGEPGVSAVPTMAMVHKVADTPWTFGLGVLGVGGSDVNYPASVLGGTNNPILFPQPHGLGRLSASVNVVQIDPTVSYQLTDRLSIGFAPTVTLADIQASPLFLGPQNQDGTYPEGIGTRYAWGGGFQVGLYYTPVADWHFGASLKSPQWMEPFRFQTQDSLGRPQVETFHLDYPLIVSVGGSYTGFENWVLGCDVRYFNYAGTAGFAAGGFAPDGALIGLDWKDVYSLAVGVQRQLSERFILRMGYCYNDNPITSEASQFNVASPLIIQHTVHVGASYVFADNWLFSMAYVHGFENEVSGPMQPAGSPPIPNTAVASKVSADTLSAGFSKRF